MDAGNGQQKGPFLVTLRIDALTYDKLRDRYNLTLTDCVLNNEMKNDDDNKNNNNGNVVSFEVIDGSKIIHVEKEKLITASNNGNKLTMVDVDEEKFEEKLATANKSLVRADTYFLIFWFFYILLAIFLFMVIEGDSFVDAFYFRIVTSFGIGYGDIVPQTTLGKMMNCLIILIDLMKLAYIDWRVMSFLFSFRSDSVYMKSSSPPMSPTIIDANRQSRFTKMVNNRNFLIYTLLILASFILCGTFIMHLSEGATWIEAFEWNFVTLSQVGYGNVIPHSIGGKLFCIIYIVVGYLILLYLAVILFDSLMSKYFDKKSKTSRPNDKIEMTGLLSS